MDLWYAFGYKLPVKKSMLMVNGKKILYEHWSSSLCYAVAIKALCKSAGMLQWPYDSSALLQQLSAMKVLQNFLSKHRLTNFIIFVILRHLFVDVVREGDFCIHIY